LSAGVVASKRWTRDIAAGQLDGLEAGRCGVKAVVSDCEGLPGGKPLLMLKHHTDHPVIRLAHPARDESLRYRNTSELCLYRPPASICECTSSHAPTWIASASYIRTSRSSLTGHSWRWTRCDECNDDECEIWKVRIEILPQTVRGGGRACQGPFVSGRWVPGGSRY
jgi:hypothetical protein